MVAGGPPRVLQGISVQCNWEPDAHAVNAEVTCDAAGVLPAANGFTFWPGLVPASGALSTQIVGGLTVRKTDGTFAVYAGTATKLEMYATTTSWTDVTRLVGGAYAVTSDQTWSMAQFGHYLIATHVADVVQVIDIDAPVNFAALAGSPPQARYVRTVGDFVMLGSTSANPNRIHWSGRNNSVFWTPGTQDCDIQDFPEGGWVRGIAPFGQSRGLIFQDSAIRIFYPVDGREIFHFELIEQNRGLVAPDSLVVIGSTAYYMSRNGFYATDGNGQSKAIGADRIDRWFNTNSEGTRIATVRGAADPARNRVFWLFASSGNVTGLFDCVLCYDISQDAWSYTFDITSSYVLPSASLGFSADDIDTYLTANGWTLETAPFSFDSAFLQGGTPVLAFFNSDFKLAFMNGEALAATIETGDWQLVPGKRAFLRGVRPLSDTTDATIAVASRELEPSMTSTYGSEITMNSQGFCPMRSSGMYHRLRLSIAAGTDWTHFHGYEIERNVVSAGLR